MLDTRTNTARSNGAVGKCERIVLPNFVIEFIRRRPNYNHILDFGCGNPPIHAQYVRDVLDILVDATDLNYNTDLLNQIKQGNAPRYDLAYASNVLNVQATHRDLMDTVKTLHNLTARGTLVLFSYPQSPRKMGLTPKQLRARIGDMGYKTTCLNHLYQEYTGRTTTTQIYILER